MDPDYVVRLAAHVSSSTANLVIRDGPKKPWIGFNYTEQDIDLHLAERASIPATFAISSIFPSLAIIAVILRFIAASKSKAGRTADDWIIFAALFPTIASCVWMIATYVVDKDRIVKSFFKEAEKGNFTELDDPLGNANALQWGPGVVTTFYLTALALIKLSILLLYRRLFDVKIMHQIVRGGIIFVCLTWVTFVIPSLLGLANKLSNGVIFDFILTFACIDLVTDVALLALPIPFILRLHMTTPRKLQIIGMFMLGAFCVISSTVRLAFLVDYWRKLQFIFAHELNWYATFTIAQFAKSWWMSWIWALIEPCTSIIAACLPTLRPLVDGVGDRLPWLGRLLGAVYPGRSVNSRSTGKASAGSDPNSSVVSADSIQLAKMAARSQNQIVVQQGVGVTREVRSPDEKMFGSNVHVAAQRPDWNGSNMNLNGQLTPGRGEPKVFNASGSVPLGLRRPEMTADRRDRTPSPLYPEYRGADWV